MSRFKPFRSFKSGIAAALVLLVGTASCQQTAPGPASKQRNAESIMKLTRYSGPLSDSEELTLQPQPLTPSREAPVLEPVAAERTDFAGRFGNAQKNGRTGYPVEKGAYGVLWEKPLISGDQASAVYGGSQRLIVGAPVWQVFNASGEEIAQGPGGVAFALHPTMGRFSYVDGQGSLRVMDRDSGQLVFRTLIADGEEFAFSLAAYFDQRQILAGSERALDPHGHHRPSKSLLQLLEYPGEIETDSDKMISNLVALRSVYLDTLKCDVAADRNVIVVTAGGLILRFDMELKVTQCLSAPFDSQALSLDESGAVHLLVKTSGVERYWRILPNGHLVVNQKMSRPFMSVPEPPIVGYDHRVFVRVTGGYDIVEADGSIGCSILLQNPAARAAALPGGGLLAHDGKKILEFAPDCSSRILVELGADSLRGAPITGPGGRIYVLAGGKLICLGPKLTKD